MLLDVPADEILDKLFLGGKIPLDSRLLHFLPFFSPSCQKNPDFLCNISSSGTAELLRLASFWAEELLCFSPPDGGGGVVVSLRVSRDGFCSTHRSGLPPIMATLAKCWGSALTS